MTVSNKTCPFNEKRICDKNCQLFVNQKCAFAIIAGSLLRVERTLEKNEIEKEVTRKP